MKAELKRVVARTRVALESQDWFAQRWILNFIAMPGRAWVGIQLSRQGWFNEEGNGIHFETWLSDEVVEEGILHFQAHVMHAGMVFPSTEKKAASLSRPLVANHRELIESWNYGIPDNPGMTLFSTRRVITRDSVVETVVREFSRFSQLGDAIDETLASLLAGRKISARRRRPRLKECLIEGPMILPALEMPGKKIRHWEYKVNASNTMTAVLENPRTLRLEISGKAPHGYDRALICHGMSFEKGLSYRVHLEAKAAPEHRISGCIMQTNKPHLSITIFPGLTVKDTWQSFSWDFVAGISEEAASLHLGLGRKPNTIWFQNFSLHRLDLSSPRPD